MSVLSKIGDFFAGAGGNVIDTVAGTVDRFVTNPDEKKAFILELKKIEEDQRQNQRRFLSNMEQLTQQRESDIELTIRTELEAQKSVLLAELQQGDNYTKRARPTVVYVGLVFILMELLGLRHMILNAMDLGANAAAIIESSDSIFKTFLTAWAGVVGVYAMGRSIEKRGTRNAWTSAMTGSGARNLSDAKESAIVKGVKDKLKDISW